MLDKFSDDTVLVDISDSDVDYSDVLLITHFTRQCHWCGFGWLVWCFLCVCVCVLFFGLVSFSLLACVGEESLFLSFLVGYFVLFYSFCLVEGVLLCVWFLGG